MKGFKDILLVINPQQESSAAMERAVTLAENNQARLTVVSTIEPVPVLPGTTEGETLGLDVGQILFENHSQALAKLVAPYAERLTIATKVLIGTPFLEVIRAVLRDRYDLVIKVAERPSWLERLLGSDDMHLLRKCPCPIWLMRDDESSNYRRILVAVDVDDGYPLPELESRHALNHQALELGVSLGLSDFAELHIVHVWDAPGESALRGAFLSKPEEEITAYVAQVRQRHQINLEALVSEVTAVVGPDAMAYLHPQLHLIKGYARREIPALAKTLNVDLIVMGTVARTGIAGFIMGNTAETILNQIDCAVLAIKPPGFHTPVTLES